MSSSYFNFDILPSANAEHLKLTWDIEEPFVSLHNLFYVLLF